MKLPLQILLAMGFASLCPERLNATYVWAWGNNTFGQTNVPAGLTNVVAVVAGDCDLALKNDGTVVAWGNNQFGKADVPKDLTNAIAISAMDHALALRANGTVTAWGYNNVGQCNVPLDLAGVVAVSSGGSHSLALRADGTVSAWGDNTYGQCNVPVGLSNVVSIVGGWVWSLALLADGKVIAWGYNLDGECDVPVDLTNVIALSAGGDHCLALRANGTVSAWGGNLWGERDVPAGLTNVTALSAGLGCSMVLKADGTVQAWGSGLTVPLGLSNVTAISAGLSGPAPTLLALAGTTQNFVSISSVYPTTQTVTVGAGAYFFVNALGPPPLTYQWHFGTNAIPGATNRVLALKNVQTSQSGAYTVVVNNHQTSATSQPMTLSVLPSMNINMVPAISLAGDLGATYRIDYLNVIGPTNAWNALGTVTLTNAVQYYVDFSSIGQPARLYRLVQLP